ncbi:MAG: alpha/beta hydrolase [Sphingobacteriaceae bacterium]
MKFYLRQLASIGFILFCFSNVKAAKVDTVNTFSPSMNKTIKAVIITPDTYKKSKKPFNVVYLLHGYGGNYKNWITIAPDLTHYVDEHNLIVVCPDGNIGSWYFDSPVDSTWKFETYVSNELVNWVDENYKTVKDRTGRGITGLSMGGHGAMYLSFKHQDVFGVAGSMSGGVDFRPFPLKWDIAKRLGSLKEQPENWDKHTVINMINLLKPGSLKLMIDCGTEDFFFEVNNNFHQKLLENKIPHDYIVRPGAHNSAYWKNAVAYQLLFMNRYFNKL